MGSRIKTEERFHFQGREKVRSFIHQGNGPVVVHCVSDLVVSYY